MIVPENPKAQTELNKSIAQNLEAGDWSSSTDLSSTVFVPMDQNGTVLKEDELPDD
jgi:hypothetical protein